MALQLQINNDINNRISIERFEEYITGLNDPEIIEDRILHSIDLDTINENVSDLLEYLTPYVVRNSITSLKIIKNNEVLYETTTYDNISQLFLRTDDNENLLFTIRFAEDEEV